MVFCFIFPRLSLSLAPCLSLSDTGFSERRVHPNPMIHHPFPVKIHSPQNWLQYIMLSNHFPCWKVYTIFSHTYIYIYILVGGFKHVLFSIMYGIILPIDFHIFQRGRYTTNQYMYRTKKKSRIAAPREVLKQVEISEMGQGWTTVYN